MIGQIGSFYLFFLNVYLFITDESMIGSKQCIGALIENNQLKPRLLNCNRKLKSLCEPGMLKVTTEPKPEGMQYTY